MKKIFLLLITLFIMAANQALAAEENLSTNARLFLDSADKEEVMRLTLGDCIETALKNNSEIKIIKIGPRIAQNTVGKHLGAYDPAVTASLSYSNSETPSAWPTFTGTTTDFEKNTDWSAGVSGLLPFGTAYEAELSTNKSETNSRMQSFYPQYTTVASISVTQPVMKGFFIDATRANIRIAKNNKKISDEDFIDGVAGVITNVENAYYDYIASQGLYETGKISLQRAEELERITEARYQHGIASNVDMLEAETGALQRKEAFLTLEGQLKKAEDGLKLILNLVDDPKHWDSEIAAVEKPQFDAAQPDLTACVEEAFLYRPDYRKAKIDLQNKDVNLKLSWDNLMPQVDLIGSLALNGLSSEYEKSTDQIFDESKYDAWSAGVSASMPIGFQEEMADLRINKLEKQKALISFWRLEQKIILEIRDAVRWVGINAKKVETAQKRSQTEEKRYLAAKERFEKGLVDTHDMLEYEEDFYGAEVSYINSVIEYNKSVANLERAKGTTLDKHNIKVDEI